MPTLCPTPDVRHIMGMPIGIDVRGPRVDVEPAFAWLSDADAGSADVDADRHAHDVADHGGGGGRHEGRVGPLAGSWLGATWEVARARGARIGRRAGRSGSSQVPPRRFRAAPPTVLP